jgi:ESF2/ABP1 family protein
MEEYKGRQNNKGVCYLSRIPPYMKPNYIKRLLENYKVERIYLLP